jgi:transcriptional regulator GlxA family with amidase domain
MKHVTILVPDGYVDLGTITGTLEVLNRANWIYQQMGREPVLDVHIAGLVTELKLEVGCFSIHPENIHDLPKPDLLVIPSVMNYYSEVLKLNRELIHWIGNQYKGGTAIASICSGSFLLAAAGLLDGKRCAMHFVSAHDFKQMFPKVDVLTDELLTFQDDIYTGGGGYSFLNLILFLIEKYFDRDTAVLCSKMYQIDIGRDSQAPYNIFETHKEHGDDLVSKAQTYMEENLQQKISFEDLASRLAISRRNFDRRFIKAVGLTPVEYLQRVKVEVAKSFLERGRKSIFEVMDEVGYSDDKAFREVFKKITGLSPVDYRTKFSKKAVLA